MAEASFTGDEFLKYSFDSNTEGDSFVLHFKTKQPAGLLYHMGKSKSKISLIKNQKLCHLNEMLN